MKTVIDGRIFSQMLLSAAAGVENQKQQINELNVFPVPDGDTGTNMSMTLNAMLPVMSSYDGAHIGKTCELASNTLLRGARGNSGVIISLLFRGFFKHVKDKETIDGADFAAALSAGVDAAYSAVMKPAEGTILTVSRKTAADAISAAKPDPDMKSVLERCIESAKLALEKTVDQNPVLKKAGVIDAGAFGFVIMLEGMYGALTGRPLIRSGGDTAESGQANFSAFSGEDIKFAYCTEFIINYENKKREPDKLRVLLENIGDSLVFVDDDSIIKIHVHTNNPGKALEEAVKYGPLTGIKIENMREQHSETVFSAPPAAPKRKIAPPEHKYGFVTVCAGEGLKCVFKDLGANQIINGGQTMNPSTEDILRAIDRTPAETVFVLPNNKNIIMAAEQCVRLSEKQVIVLPTKSIPQGISALLSVNTGEEAAQIRGAMLDAVGRVKTALITYAARDSEYDGKKIKKGDYIALLESSLFGTDKKIQNLIKKIAKTISKENYQFITVFYGQDIRESDAAETEALFKEECKAAEISLLDGGQPVYSYIISAE